ncbi:Acetyltransferase (GNAT) domain-containing protein [Anaerovirgula multivorans]|uniref:Acetyltransferase (GNAT) domain-containing protein n=1 Tax=Anaerovirgula multivorans TaxID=312168 RepID=A0A239GX52_9FIRM|nr:GNAT family N-acetyltransferase [Anaerovirgula multivorans]SNS73472.1 Acetyltransferase (GNAT) domain-containing protein [Anaerovirgula multivorans]
MIVYDNCSHVEFHSVYNAFQIGFSDYMIKIEMSEENFLKRFFGPEGNQLEHSFIALDGGEPIGVILGGIKDYEGVKTLRCGTLCVHPDYRGKGVSKELFQLHKQVAVVNDCKQMFLEILVGNDRALKFYKNLGYEKIYDLSYYTYEDQGNLKKKIDDSIGIQKVSFEAIRMLSNQIEDVHINWQNDFDYMEKLESLIHYGVYQDSELIGALSLNTDGKIYFIWIKPSYRHKGIAKNMIMKASKELYLNKLSISFPNNAGLAGFLKRLNFQREEIAQYEMYLTL